MYKVKFYKGDYGEGPRQANEDGTANAIAVMEEISQQHEKN